jgi:uroporphyrinogen decarboxylase
MKSVQDIRRNKVMNSRERVNTAIAHKQPDRVPVDFLAVPEIWHALENVLPRSEHQVNASAYFDSSWESILRKLEVDCRVISYDQFCEPPKSVFRSGGEVEWWNVQSRSTPSRMWRWKMNDGLAYDVFGRCFRTQKNASGSYEENVPVLVSAKTIEDLKSHAWPEADWWDFGPVNSVIQAMNSDTAHHIRYRIGSVFEIAWQLRGMDNFLMDMALEPDIPRYIMERLTDVYVENINQVLTLASDDIDMVYFYDDMASNSSLLISLDMYDDLIRPCHARIVAAAKKYGKKVMYHSDGALHPLIERLIDIGVDVLNPIQPNVLDMEPERLKKDFGDRLSFHGGIDIIDVLPKGTPDRVRAEAQRLISILGHDGGYILASSHHIQADTPLENILALYELGIR